MSGTSVGRSVYLDNDLNLVVRWVAVQATSQPDAPWLIKDRDGTVLLQKGEL